MVGVVENASRALSVSEGEDENDRRHTEGEEGVVRYRVRGTGEVVGVVSVLIGGERTDASGREGVREDVGPDSHDSDDEPEHGEAGDRQRTTPAPRQPADHSEDETDEEGDPHRVCRAAVVETRNPLVIVW